MRNLLLLIFFLASYSLNAQITKSDESDSEQIIIKDGDATTKSNTKVTKNILKVDVLGVLYGQYGLTYERELLDFLTIQSSVGMTYINFSEIIFSGLSFKNEIYPKGSNEVLRLKDFRRESIINTQPGYFFNLMPKVYFEKNGFEDLYVGLGFNYKRNNYKYIENISNYVAVNNTQIGGEFSIGYQWINGKRVLDLSAFYELNSNKANVNLLGQQYEAQYLNYYFGFSLKLGRYF